MMARIVIALTALSVNLITKQMHAKSAQAMLTAMAMFSRRGFGRVSIVSLFGPVLTYQ